MIISHPPTHTHTHAHAHTHTRVHTHTHYRIIIGAPRGTYPGGLNLTDPGRPREDETGLVYSCPILPGPCEGVRGDTSLYLDESNLEVLNNDLSLFDSQLTVPPPFPINFTEGRLFDQAREYCTCITVVTFARTAKFKYHQIFRLYGKSVHFYACCV